MSQYVEKEVLSDFAQEIDAIQETSQDLLLVAASRLFDNLCEVSDGFFDTISDTETRTFYGDGTAYLKVPPYVVDPDDIVVLPTVTIPGEEYEVATTDWRTQGQFLVWIDKAGRTHPDAIVNRYTGWQEGVAVDVRATWGWEATPDDVKMATIQLALHLWRSGDPAFAVVSGTDKAISPTALPIFATEIADKYRRIYSEKAVF